MNSDVEIELIKHWIKLLPYISSGLERQARESLREIITSYVDPPIIVTPHPDIQVDRGMVNPYRKPYDGRRVRDDLFSVVARSRLETIEEI